MHTAFDVVKISCLVCIWTVWRWPWRHCHGAGIQPTASVLLMHDEPTAVRMAQDAFSQSRFSTQTNL